MKLKIANGLRRSVWKINKVTGDFQKAKFGLHSVRQTDQTDQNSWSVLEKAALKTEGQPS